MKTSGIRKLGDVFTLQRGFDITKKEQSEGIYPIVSSSGVNSYHNKYKVKGPGVVIGRKGTLGTAFYLEGNYWPHDTSLCIKDFKGNNPKFIYYFLKALSLEKLDTGSANLPTSPTYTPARARRTHARIRARVARSLVFRFL